MGRSSIVGMLRGVPEVASDPISARRVVVRGARGAFRVARLWGAYSGRLRHGGVSVHRESAILVINDILETYIEFLVARFGRVDDGEPDEEVVEDEGRACETSELP